jgi:hypothetical protein
VRVPIKIVFLFTDYSAELMLFGKRQKHTNQQVSEKIVTERIARHVHQFSVHQFVIERQFVREPFEIINGERADELHNPILTPPP